MQHHLARGGLSLFNPGQFGFIRKEACAYYRVGTARTYVYKCKQSRKIQFVKTKEQKAVFVPEEYKQTYTAYLLVY